LTSGASEAALSLPFDDHLAEHQAVFARVGALAPLVQQATVRMAECLRHGGKLMWCGNGGSAADAQHIAAELTGRFVADRRPLAALALSTDTSALTSIANDYAFERVFERQLRALGRAGDLLVVISTSGRSANLLRAAEAAREMQIETIGLLGRDGGPLRDLCDLALVVQSQTTARIQEVHIFIGHTLCAGIEHSLGL
jgi:D-sedoheptulose 7-phosphate isomerase